MLIILLLLNPNVFNHIFTLSFRIQIEMFQITQCLKSIARNQIQIKYKLHNFTKTLSSARRSYAVSKLNKLIFELIIFIYEVLGMYQDFDFIFMSRNK